MSTQLRAGTGGAHITPPIGFLMGGYGARDHGAEGVHDHLNSHALFLDDGTTQVVLLSNDILGLRGPQVARVRQLVSAATGVPASHVFVACSHTHGGPLTYTDFAPFSTEHQAYLETLYHYMAGAAQQAAKSAVPVHYGFGRQEVQLGANRRERQADGTVRIGYNPDGPVAPWTDVLCFERADGSGTLALLYQHAVHGTCLVGNNYQFTADSMGYATGLIEAQLPGSTALFVNGCAGNINPYPRGSFALAQRHGTRLGAAVLQAVMEIEDMRPQGRLCSVQHQFELPLESALPLEKCEENFAAVEPEYRKLGGANHQDWNLARRYFAVKDQLAAARGGAVADGLPLEVQVVGLDDIALVSLPGEIFVETGFAIAAASPFAHTLPVGYANGSIGYVPTGAEIPHGGYEVENARAKYQGRNIGAGADRALAAGAVAALEQAAVLLGA